ncbi:hypothetical protein HPC49_14670 [Pyxidicoccus fallax]|uniref:Uncharacterized protein n=1 Tax=Pyxidicoccus fallax TaxID=394095 RepID=A0A848LHT8_9BACT|nr:hypothetical protein [Pyxidicoccus fallax]NMO16458.1 hypothetical protein [Pyxidicoccus fallax]NPC79475.1 hypothetical protein [Pyxidicoccus fallax]
MTAGMPLAIYTVTLHGLDIACGLHEEERASMSAEAIDTVRESFSRDALSLWGLERYEEKDGGALVEVTP